MTLQDLRDKELISAEEYQQKREQILGEIWIAHARVIP